MNMKENNEIVKTFVVTAAMKDKVLKAFRNTIKEEALLRKTEIEAGNDVFSPFLGQLALSFKDDELAIIDKYCAENYKHPVGTFNLNKLTKLSTRDGFISDLKRERIEGGVSEATTRGLTSENFIMSILASSKILSVGKQRSAHTQSDLQSSIKLCGINTSNANSIFAKYPHLFNCHIDLLLKNSFGAMIFELKSTSKDLPQSHLELSDAHTCQIQAYLMITGLKRAYAVFTHCNNEPNEQGQIEIIDEIKIIKVEQDLKKQHQLKDAIVSFWASILHKIEHPEDTEGLSSLCDNVLIIDNELNSLNERAEALYEKYISPLELQGKKLKNQKEELIEKAKLISPETLKKNNGFLSTWKTTTGSGTVIDEDAIIAQYKDLKAITYKPSVSKAKLKKEAVYGELIAKGLVKIKTSYNVSVKPKIK